ncbi:hypothetical protein MLD38_031196 [Melastoma candidum]|uniref:Uncharacterized protein n=1 Tax=Melastoma candidum TaxID=119954 RepID=A0ACB9MQI8_9MYRT|nr:hypothetical protein MLD38_031196 [Melastoma candidum]
MCSEPASDVDADQSSTGSRFDTTLADKESEIKTLEGVLVELEKKLEDLQQLAANPTSILSEILGIASAKAKEMEKKASSSSAVVSFSRVASCNNSEGFDSPTVSTAHTNGTSSGVTDLGVVGRGVKRVSMSSGAVQPSPTKKKSQLGIPEEKRDGNAS